MKSFPVSHYLNKIIVFYFPEKANYWHTVTPCKIDRKPNKLGTYYLDFISKADFPGKFTNEGVPLYDYPNKEPFVHPIVVCQYALGLYEKLLRNDFTDHVTMNKFLIQTEWLRHNWIKSVDSAIWQIWFDIPEYRLFQPWYSALAQGEAVSVLTRAYLLTGDEGFIKLSEKAIVPFNLPVNKGGLINYFDNIPIFEEYPSPFRTVGVLNGFIFSLFGLFDLYLLNQNQNAARLLNMGIDSLKKILKNYDLRFWSQYYLFDYPKSYTSSSTYHRIMFNQLEAMYFLTGEKLFFDYAKKWQSYERNYFYKTRALFDKLVYSKKIV